MAENGVLAVKTLFHTTYDDFTKWWYRRDSTHICFYSPRTFAIISHPDAGKTTLTEKLLLYGGAVRLIKRCSEINNK